MLACGRSMDSLEPAPTEEGFHMGGRIEQVLSELQAREEPPAPQRRWSRSFSEPNLYMHFLLQARAFLGNNPALPCIHPLAVRVHCPSSQVLP
jgi:hypothetical protein